MSPAIQPRNHPFRFLLYLEWGLLAVAIVSALETPPARIMRSGFGRPHPPPLGGWEAVGWGYSPLMAVIPLMIFGLMGLYLPQTASTALSSPASASQSLSTHSMPISMPSKLLPLGHALGQVLLILVASVTVFNGGRIFPLVYLILVIRSCLMFELAGRLVMAGIAFALFLAGLQLRLRSLGRISRLLPPEMQQRLAGFILGLHLNVVVLFGLSLLLVVLLINALLTERQSQQRLQKANQQLQKSAQEIEALAMDQERSRIARDIHDSLGHSLTALNIQLESALKLWEKDPPRAQQFLNKAKSLGTQSLQEVRHSVTTLRQDPLAGDTLAGAISRLLKDFQTNQSPSNMTGSTFKVTQEIHLNRLLPANLNAILYRIVQAGLTNIVKHANASHVHLQLVEQRVAQQAGSMTTVMLTLTDNGVGFDPKQAKTGFGLQSMRDRVQSIGGTLLITSPLTASGGTRIQVRLSMPA
ncbi:MAG: sensor histidine kinase [Phormidesmis sp. RL_2_1]|nr:sensor histidine kinase [Phormidesmis sp. RL_2_1]